MSDRHSSVLLPACLLGGSLAAAVAYIYFTSPSARKNTGKARGVPGLYNLGNTCYTNALLQGLASMPSFVRWLDQMDLSDTDLKEGFVKELREIILKLNDGSSCIYSAAAISSSLAHCHKWNIQIGVEHDLYELFGVFVNAWDVELSFLKKGMFESSLINLMPSTEPSSSMSLKIDWAGDSNAIECGSKANDRKKIIFERCAEAVRLDSRLRAPCFGLMATQLQCCQSDCGFKKVRQDKISVISLAIPKSFNGVRITLEALLRKYFCMEVIRGATCDECKEKKGRVDSGLLKKQGLSKLPQTLVIRIERCGVLPSGHNFKLSDHVDFAETLDVRDLCFYRNKEDDYNRSKLNRTDLRSPETTSRIVGGAEHNEFNRLARGAQQNGIGMDRTFSLIDGGSFVAERKEAAKYSYQLRAVNEHRGVPETGHFVTYRRGLKEKEHCWYFASDAQVLPVPYSQVANAQAYMLYYERIQSNRWYKNANGSGNVTFNVPE